VPWIDGRNLVSKRDRVIIYDKREGTMKRVALPISLSRVFISVICMLIIFMIDCTSAGKKQEAYWNAQIGVAKYDDVVTRLGPPIAKETLSDKSIVAKWVRTAYGTTRSYASTDNWTEELVLRFSPSGILTQSTLHEY
jgi:hypothetical protein